MSVLEHISTVPCLLFILPQCGSEGLPADNEPLSPTIASLSPCQMLFHALQALLHFFQRTYFMMMMMMRMMQIISIISSSVISGSIIGIIILRRAVFFFFTQTSTRVSK